MKNKHLKILVILAAISFSSMTITNTVNIYAETTEIEEAESAETEETEPTKSIESEVETEEVTDETANADVATNVDEEQEDVEKEKAWYHLDFTDILIQMITPLTVALFGYIYFCKNRTQ